jgi:hypothetical protein
MTNTELIRQEADRTRMLGRRLVGVGVFGALLVALVTSAVRSVPRLGVERAMPCRTCHINPNGGGMRNEFGNHAVALNELCLPQTKKILAESAASPRIAPSLLIGFDARYLLYDDGTVFRMQTDFFADINPLKNLHYQMRFGESGISENYALAYFKNQKYYFKAGRFYPAYGLRVADHKAFIRERSGHPSNLYLDGFSAGGDYRGVNVVVEGFNINSRNVYGLHIYGHRQLAPVSLMAGASIRLSEELSGSNGPFPHAKALFGGVAWNRHTLMGEFDFVGRANDTLLAYLNLTSRIEYGLYVVGEYNFFDGDRDTKGSVDEFLRLSAEVFPIPFVQVRPSYTYYTRGHLEKTDEFFVQFHFGY